MFERLAHLVTTRARLILALTVLGIVLAGAAGIHATSKLKDAGFVSANAPSQIASNKLDADFSGPANVILLVSARTGSVNSPAVASIGRSVTARLAAFPGVTGVTSYWSTGSAALESKTGTAALVLGHITGSDNTVNSRAKAIGAQLSTRSGPATVTAGGSAVVSDAVGKAVVKGLAIAEAIAIPLTMILLVLAFGSVVAAAMPVVIGLISIVTTLAVLWVLGSITSVSQYALNLTTAMSLGLAIDYSLLMVNRYREELGAGNGVNAAITAAVATAGRTILFSAATVAAALAALLVFPVYFLRSMAYAGISVVLLATVGALVVLPAMLALLGLRINAWPVRLPFGRHQYAGATGGESPFWRRTATAVMKRPVAAAVPIIVLLGVLAVPFLHVNFGTPDDRVLNPGATGRQVGDVLRAQFSSDAADTTEVVTSRPLGQSQAAAYSQSLSALPGVKSVAGPAGVWVQGRQVPLAPALLAATSTRYQSPGASWFSADTPDPLSLQGQALVGTVRALTVPGGATSYVGGAAAALVDQKHDLGSQLPLAIGLIALTTFVILWLFTGSVVLPVKALVLNALTLTAVLGLMVWIFQYGHLSGLLNFTPLPMSTTMPLLLFCIAFGLSMDYEVFVLSRIKELHDAGASNQEAVVGGLARTGRIVTTAAALMAVTFFSFAVSTVSFIQMFALGTGLAVLIDATLIRGVLVPAFMRVAGDWNWWSPALLRRLHRRIGISERPVVR
ncbi:MAG TPA: MMPL family transporter, partial [Acidimicrobiales bacterium]|nr:MMPL family transporter [Acidimicrobiales bacterium]